MSPTQTALAGHPVPSTALLGVLREMAPPQPTLLLPFLLPVNGAYRRKRDIDIDSTSSSSSSRSGFQTSTSLSRMAPGCLTSAGNFTAKSDAIATCSSCKEPPPIHPLGDNDPDNPTQTATATVPSISTHPAVDISSLPKGWQPKEPRTKLYPIPVIVTCSIFLAIVIVVTIWLCSISRRRRRVRLHAMDVESRSKIKQIAMDDDDNASESAQDPNDVWAFGHSTSRLVATKPRRLRFRGAWYRPRKSRRQLNVQPSTPQNDVLHNQADDEEMPPSVSPHSRPPTPTTPHHFRPSSNLSALHRRHSPPTYAFHQIANVRSTLDSHEGDDDSFHAVSHHDDALSLSLPATRHQYQEGHVATDDKATLARRAQMCTVPLPSLPPHSEIPSGSSIPIPAAPEWTDDLDFPPAPESEPTDGLASDPEFTHPDHRHGGRRTASPHRAAESSSSGKILEDIIRLPDDDDGLDDDGILRLIAQEEGKISPPPPWAQRSLDVAYAPSITLPPPPPPHPSITREHARLRLSHSRERTLGHENNADDQKNEIEEEETFHRALGLSIPYLPSSTPSLPSLSITHSSLHDSQSFDPHFSSILSSLPQYLHPPGSDIDVEPKNGTDGSSTPPDDSPIAVVRRHSAVPSAPPLEDDDDELASHRPSPSAPPMQEEEYR
ncbi:hypothetical protein BS47DRAFT_1487113 [Hydnum rufescens UP504]|uniref:Uncharacterized protein n=1 Tax=Hydnum rufescens UP504 TaxID=1448309 RepID=A0A9P6AUE2_9AGAM|nr:hypothetical protein BS47DRAFT_1487113 [Hydnum rufescens UP504]